MIIYIGKEALETIAIFDDEYPNLHEIFKSHATICIDLSDEELDEILSDEESDISQFCLKNNIKIIPLKDYFKSLREDITQIVEKPHAMFFFDITISEANKLSSKYGVIVQSEMEINDSVLQFFYRKNFVKGMCVEGCSDGWSNLLKDIIMPPMNSLIVSDDYLFQNIKQRKIIGFENLKMIFNSILPSTMDTLFQILIVAPMSTKLSPEKAKDLYNDLNEHLKTIRPYTIQLEMVFNNTIHPRRIFSNYFLFDADKGFQLFEPVHNTKIYQNNKLKIYSVLHDPVYSSGDTELEIATQDIKEIRDGLKNLKEQIINKADNTKAIIKEEPYDYDIDNRLIWG